MKVIRKGSAAHVTVIVSGAEAEEIARDLLRCIRNMERSRKAAGKEPFGYFLDTEPEIGANEKPGEQSEFEPA